MRITRSGFAALFLLLLVAEAIAAAAPPAGLHRPTSRFKAARNTYGSHYVTGFSAIPLKQGNGFYKNTLVSLNTVAYGVTKKFSVVGAIELFSILRNRSNGPVYSLRTQLAGPISDKFHLAGSVSYLNLRIPTGTEPIADVDLPGGLFLAMGTATLGSADHHLSLSAGWTHNGQELARGPALSLAGATRVLTNLMLVTENWLFQDPDRNFLAHSLALRVLGDDLAIDVGVTYDEQITVLVTPIGLPFVSATLNF
jgi:hypothetical protein